MMILRFLGFSGLGFPLKLLVLDTGSRSVVIAGRARVREGAIFVNQLFTKGVFGEALSVFSYSVLTDRCIDYEKSFKKLISDC